MKILIIRFTSMGDVILATSLFSYLKDVYPAAQLYFLTDKSYAGLFEDDSRLSLVIASEKKNENDIGIIYGIQWDMVIDLQNNRRSRRIRQRVHSKAKPSIFKKNLKNRALLLIARIDLYDPADYVAKRYIDAARPEKKITVDIPSPRIFIDDKKGSGVCDSLFREKLIRPLLAMMPFSAWKNKEWIRHYYQEVGRYFLAQGWDVLILGGPDDHQAAIDLKSAIGSRCMELAGRLSLYECACVFKRCSLAVGNDTGLSHMARACGIKTGVIFGSTTFHFGFFPFGDPPFKIFQSDCFCRPCHPHGGNVCFLKNRSCLQRIKPDTVIRGLEELLEIQ
jgi:heptosyltransferase II